MRLSLFRPAFGFPGWVSVPFWWESAPKDLFGCDAPMGMLAQVTLA